MPRKKMSLQPLWLRSMRTGVASCRIGNGRRAALQQLRAHAQRIIGRMPGAKHPLIAAHGSHAAPHLIGQSLKCQPAISGGQRAGKAIARSIALLQAARKIPIASSNRRLRSFSYPLKGISVRPRDSGPRRQMKSMNGVEKKQCPYALVEVFAGVP